MITKQKLQIFSAIYTQYQVADFSLDILQGLSIADLLALSTYQEDKQLAFRSAWMFETIVLKDKSLLSVAIYRALIKNLSGLNNWSCARSYSKVLLYITSSKANHIELKDEESEVIIEVCFNWLTDPNCPIAVLTNCMDILNQMSVQFPWLKEEVHTQIDYLLRINPTPAIRSRALKILKTSKKD
ncbi:hypothetical protein LZQ00_07145 [Sphingobacterium sp. SRCM116780]|uniref:hypothetical protein n=1 Tax=Sphingobacterium sp. SRCM116780 TaxID=2907623 RepID=UPI001F2913BA|nr:hypothetical protein [Sphingobacterium sp. SRCM116780]UIR57588.1 hypothetical protein LZQ00_07145 [Sphingobacterium sp. SRCM116780]